MSQTREGLRRSSDGWQDEELGKVYDHQVMARFLPYLKPYKKRVALALGGMLLFAAASYSQPYLIGLAIDRAQQANLRDLTVIGVVLAALAVVAWAAQYLQLAHTAWIGHRILYTLRTKMFDHLMRLSLRFYDRNEVGRVMSRVQNDVTVLQDLLTSGLLT
ncbi:MAG TPA: ABC transporter transmembrane domain-containing protein, partial [Dehalococcoidia bacterium]|nr:ABC transporter transmembrane domain-containing protein [Dehalococcoidia bacterium]